MNGDGSSELLKASGIDSRSIFRVPSDIMDIALGIFLGWVVCAILAGVVAGKEKQGTGVLLGFLLGPFGILIAALVGSRAATERARLEEMVRQNARRPGNAAAPSTTSKLADVPTTLTIKRDGQIIGTWSLEEVLGYLETGELVGSDQYLHDPENGTWRILSRIA
jgi:hypothetical protein